MEIETIEKQLQELDSNVDEIKSVMGNHFDDNATFFGLLKQLLEQSKLQTELLSDIKDELLSIGQDIRK